MALHKKLTNFTRTSAGLEKTLRLIQAIAQIAAELSHDHASVTRWTTAKSQLALTRRYFRFFNFLDAFDTVYTLLGTSSGQDGLFVRLIDLSRFTCLGLYFLLEDLTILHAMNINPQSWTWNKNILTEAYKFWFYALSLSLLGATFTLLSTFGGSSQTQGQVKVQGKGKKGKSVTISSPGSQRKAATRATMLRRIVVDGCDLLIPGVFLGWVLLGDLGVGGGMVLSTVVSGGEVWGRVNS